MDGANHHDGGKSQNHSLHEQSMLTDKTSVLGKVRPNQAMKADDLILISKIMAERTFKKLEDYFLND